MGFRPQQHLEKNNITIAWLRKGKKISTERKNLGSLASENMFLKKLPTPHQTNFLWEGSSNSCQMGSLKNLYLNPQSEHDPIQEGSPTLRKI